MKKYSVLFCVFLLSLVLSLGICSAAMGQSETLAKSSLGTVERSSAGSAQTYHVHFEPGCYGAIVKPSGNGLIDTQFFSTQADFEAALEKAGLSPTGDPMSTTSTYGAPLPSGSYVREGMFPAAQLGQRITTNSWISGNGSRRNHLQTILGYYYNSALVTEISQAWAAAGIWSPWAFQGSASQYLGSWPAASVRYQVTQAYKWVYSPSTTYSNWLRNETTARGDGSHSVDFYYYIDYRLAGSAWSWTGTSDNDPF